MINLHTSYLILLFYFICSELILINGQYNQLTQCDEFRLQRCQRDIQDVGSQSFIGSLADIFNSFQTNQGYQCSAVRQNLNCLLAYTPHCQEGSISTTAINSVDLIYRAKMYLDRLCDRNTGWKTRSCYQRSEVRECENQYSGQMSTQSCRNFDVLRTCVVNALSVSCNAYDIDFLGSYLIDKGQELSWSCPFNYDPNYYQLINGNVNANQYNQYTTSYNTLDPNIAQLTDNCNTKSGAYIKSCEDSLIQSQMEARRGRSGYDVQRRMCCALFFYRDCIRRLVIQRCPNQGMTVETLLGSRSRELTETCRDYSQSLCSASMTIKISNTILLYSFIIITITIYLIN